MLRVKKREQGEEMGEFLHRANGILRNKLGGMTSAHETWDLRATQLRFDWGGHVARLRHLDPNRLTYRVFMHWNYEGIVKGIEAHNKGKQCHNRHLHVWRWEYNMYRFVGRDWTSYVMDREVWREKVGAAKFKATKGAIVS